MPDKGITSALTFRAVHLVFEVRRRQGGRDNNREDHAIIKRCNYKEEK